MAGEYEYNEAYRVRRIQVGRGAGIDDDGMERVVGIGFWFEGMDDDEHPLVVALHADQALEIAGALVDAARKVNDPLPQRRPDLEREMPPRESQ